MQKRSWASNFRHDTVGTFAEYSHLYGHYGEIKQESLETTSLNVAMKYISFSHNPVSPATSLSSGVNPGRLPNEYLTFVLA
jgi:hypothetical protein